MITLPWCLAQLEAQPNQSAGLPSSHHWDAFHEINLRDSINRSYNLHKEGLPSTRHSGHAKEDSWRKETHTKTFTIERSITNTIDREVIRSCLTSEVEDEIDDVRESVGP